MSNYVQTTFFTPKDSLPPSDPNKTIFGSAYDVEFGNIASAISSKLDLLAVSTAPVAFYIGTAPLPGITFAGHTGTGLYSNAGGDLGLSAGGASALIVSGSTQAVTISTALISTSLSVTASTIPANGVYLSAANTLALASNTTLRGSVNATGNWVLAAPSAGVGLTVNGLNAQAAANFTNSTNPFIQVTDGTVQAYIQAVTAGSARFGSLSNVKMELATNATVALSIDTSQIVSIFNGTSLGPVYSGIPLNAQSTNYILALADANKCVLQANGSGTVTVPTNASVAFPLGTAITIYNNTAGNITIPTAGDTVRFGPTGSSGTRTLAQNGVATILKLASTTWVISGTGLT